ncbi:MAG: Bax inhibitor-1/YccA family protein [Candidatus Omnitrophica bacterium]|nr:Bax inhibitor-1/YccA family protein [Candidatus Omnitrophota bacterium]
MNPNNEQAFSFEKTQQTFLQRVYQWMAIGLALTGAIAYMVSGNMGLMRSLAGGGFLVLMIAEFALVWWLSANVLNLSPSAAVTGFLVYSGLNGLTLSYLFLVYTGASIAMTFFVTAGMFASVSIYGYTTKTSLASLQSFFFMAIIGLLIASLVNFFLKSPMLYWLISYAGVAIFMGLTAYDTQKLKAMQERGGATEQLAVFGALMLYLDFINMFIFLMRILGRRK